MDCGLDWDAAGGGGGGGGACSFVLSSALTGESTRRSLLTRGSLLPAQRIREAVDSETQEPLELPAVHFFCGHAYNEHNCETDAVGALPASPGAAASKSVYVCKLCRAEQQSILNLTAPGQVRVAGEREGGGGGGGGYSHT